MYVTRVLLTSGIALLLAAPALAGDVIVQKGGRTYGGTFSVPPTDKDFADCPVTVVEENLDKVVVQLAGVATPQSIKASEVVATYHDPALTPAGLLLGRKQLEGGQYEDAMTSFQQAAGDSRAQKWAQAEAAYSVGVCLWQGGDLDDAAKAFDGFLQAWKQSKHVPAATQANARIKLQKGDVEGARAAFASLKSMKDLPEAEAIEVDFWITWIDEQVAVQKNDKPGLEKTLKGYEALGRALKPRKELQDLYGKCQVGAISCMLALGRHAEGLTEATKLVEENKAPFVRAGGHTLLGRAIVLQNASTNDKAKYKEALLHFLKVITLYGNEPGADEWMAESLFRAGELFNELRPTQANTDEEKEKAADARRRARREWQECVQRFPRSQWAAKARRSLGGS